MIEMLPKVEMSKVQRKVINWTIEVSSKVEVGDGRRKPRMLGLLLNWLPTG